MSIRYNTLVILKNEEIVEGIHKLTLTTGIDLKILPGQFILLDCVKSSDRHKVMSYLLKRPFSFYKLIDNYTFEIIVRVKGEGTRNLVSLEKGSEINFLGPLGTPPPLSDICQKYPEGISLVGGGMGIIPLVLLAQCFSVCKYRRAYAYLGFKTHDAFSNMVHMDIYKLIQWTNVESSYEDIDNETAIDVFNNFNDKITTPIFTCGPEPMMEAVHKRCIEQENKFPCFCFMEKRMACGIGICHSCNVNGKSVCKDGPCIESKYIFK